MDGHNMFKGVGEFIVGLIVICTIAVVSWIVYGLYCLFSGDDIEVVSDKPLVTELRLVTDGKKIDTVYVYKIED